MIHVTLNQPTAEPLIKDAFSIICNSGGSDMTVLDVSTSDNKVYKLKTGYYKDQEYDLEITLADGTRISKVFEYRTDCAQITDTGSKRTSDTTATITFVSDEPGEFYYITQEQAPVLRTVRMKTVAAESAETLAEEEIINTGTKVIMTTGLNSFEVSGLEAGKAYTLRYVAVNPDGKRTLIKTIDIPAEVAQPDGPITITSAQRLITPFNANEFIYGFEITFSAVIKETLTIDNFNIHCPKNETTLDPNIQTDDNQTYKVYMPRGTVPKGRNHYTIEVTFADGTIASGSCYMDIEAPNVSFREFTWQDENTLIARVNSSEAGTLYYAIQDEVEGEGTTAPKDPTPIYEHGQKFEMGYGLNDITLVDVTEGQWFCFASEDDVGNRENFYTYKQIPAYTEPEPEDPNALKIVSVTKWKDPYFSSRPAFLVEFNKNVMDFMNDYTQFGGSGITGKVALDAVYPANGDMRCIGFSLRSPSTVTPGEYTITLSASDVSYGDENYQLKEYSFKFNWDW